MTHHEVVQEPSSRPASRSWKALEDIQIATPCQVPWDSLRGDDRVRACGRCQKNVYNVSEMTRVEALSLIRRHEGRVCLRIHRRPDGTVVTGDCWSRLRAARRRGLLSFVAVLLAIAWMQLVGGARVAFGRDGTPVLRADNGDHKAKGKGKGAPAQDPNGTDKKKKERPPKREIPDGFPEPNMGSPVIE